MKWCQLERFSFGDSPALADELAALVLAGTKTATCWAASDGASTYVGKQMVVLSGAERPLAIIETVELTQRRFSDVDAQHVIIQAGSHATELQTPPSTRDVRDTP
jgi:uncharacterized protein YhfF